MPATLSFSHHVQVDFSLKTIFHPSLMLTARSYPAMSHALHTPTTCVSHARHTLTTCVSHARHTLSCVSSLSPLHPSSQMPHHSPSSPTIQFLSVVIKSCIWWVELRAVKAQYRCVCLMAGQQCVYVYFHWFYGFVHLSCPNPPPPILVLCVMWGAVVMWGMQW